MAAAVQATKGQPVLLTVAAVQVVAAAAHPVPHRAAVRVEQAAVVVEAVVAVAVNR